MTDRKRIPAMSPMQFIATDLTSRATFTPAKRRLRMQCELWRYNVNINHKDEDDDELPTRQSALDMPFLLPSRSVGAPILRVPASHRIG